MEINKIVSTLGDWYGKIHAYCSPSRRVKLIVIFFVVFILLIYIGNIINPPRNFPLGNIYTIHSGDSLQQISSSLKNEKIIKSDFVFSIAVIILGGERKIKAGDYLLDKKENSLILSWRLVNGYFHLKNVKITIPEGWNVYKIAEYLSENLIGFNKEDFINQAKSYEGYLFPDTYFVSPTVKIKDLISLMNRNFEDKLGEIKEIRSFPKPLGDIMVMASILEGEALPQDRKIVSGILWKRLSIGMPLQVDSTFMYINGKNTYDLTLDDLKIDSSYNTYKYKGLPPSPISNPGADAILSAVTPIQSDYLYFLTSRDGSIYYAKTFEEHLANKKKYLR